MYIYLIFYITKKVNVEHEIIRCVCENLLVLINVLNDASTKQTCLTIAYAHNKIRVYASIQWKSCFVINESNHFVEQKGSKVFFFWFCVISSSSKYYVRWKHFLSFILFMHIFGEWTCVRINVYTYMRTKFLFILNFGCICI